MFVKIIKIQKIKNLFTQRIAALDANIIQIPAKDGYTCSDLG